MLLLQEYGQNLCHSFLAAVWSTDLLPWFNRADIWKSEDIWYVLGFSVLLEHDLGSGFLLSGHVRSHSSVGLMSARSMPYLDHRLLTFNTLTCLFLIHWPAAYVSAFLVMALNTDSDPWVFLPGCSACTRLAPLVSWSWKPQHREDWPDLWSQVDSFWLIEITYVGRSQKDLQ